MISRWRVAVKDLQLDDARGSRNVGDPVGSPPPHPRPGRGYLSILSILSFLRFFLALCPAWWRWLCYSLVVGVGRKEEKGLIRWVIYRIIRLN